MVVVTLEAVIIKRLELDFIEPEYNDFHYQTPIGKTDESG